MLLGQKGSSVVLGGAVLASVTFAAWALFGGSWEEVKAWQRHKLVTEQQQPHLRKPEACKLVDNNCSVNARVMPNTV